MIGRLRGVNVMSTATPADAAALARERFISITTFKRDGTPVATPVWCAGENGSLLVYSEADSGKVKRIRRDRDISVAPCTARGKPLGPAVQAHATIIDDTARVEALLAAKYGWVWAAYNRLMAGVRRVRRQAPPKAVTIRITLGRAGR
jgi:PPOX class probable F420-dependent enzyme